MKINKQGPIEFERATNEGEMDSADYRALNTRCRVLDILKVGASASGFNFPETEPDVATG